MKGSQYLGHRKVHGVPPYSSPCRDLADTKRIASSVSHCLEMWNQPEGAHPSQHTLSSGLRGSHMALQSLGLKGEFKVSKTYFS